MDNAKKSGYRRARKRLLKFRNQILMILIYACENLSKKDSKDTFSPLCKASI